MSNPFPRKRRTPKRLTVEDVQHNIDKYRGYAHAMANLGAHQTDPSRPDEDHRMLYDHIPASFSAALGHACVVCFLEELKYQMEYAVEED